MSITIPLMEEASEILFWTKVAALGQIAGAAATFLAVVVSLYLSTSGRREKLKLVVGERIIVAGGTDAHTEVIAFNVTNMGDRSVFVLSFGWRVGRLPRLFGRWAAQHAYQLQDDFHGDYPPFELLPGQSKTGVIRLQPWRAEGRDLSLFAPVKVWRSRTIDRRIFGVVHTQKGTTVVTAVEKGLQDTLSKLAR